MRKKKIIGLAHGVFDVLHSGHLLHFEECKKFCDQLIVSITDDNFVNKGPNRPFFNSSERVKILKSVKFIDKVLINKDHTPIKLIKKLKPDYYFKGKDYMNLSKDLTGNIKKEKQEIEKFGGRMIFTQSKMRSSSSIINNDFNFLGEDVKKIIKIIDKKKIINFLKEKITNKINKKILILGDPIIDKYTYVETLGKSQKNQIIVTKFKEEKTFGGGSLLVSIFLEKLFRNVNLISIRNNFNNKFYKKFLNKKINKILIADENSKMTIKNRFVNHYRGERLYQINHNDSQTLSKLGNTRLISYLKKSIKIYDKIIIFDFGHGIINSDSLKFINKYSDKFLINCQSNSSNFGFNIASKYKSGHAICMDEMEFRLCVRDKESSIKHLINQNSKFINKFKYFVITMGKEGSFVIKNREIIFVPTIYKSIKDTTGSGDIFFSMFAYLITSSKLGVREITFLSHVSAGLHSIQEGNESKDSLKDILRVFENLIK